MSLPRTLPELHSLLFDREFALCVAQTKRAEVMVRVYDWDDEAAMSELAPYNDAVEAAERRVEAVKEVIGWLTPSSYLTNYR